MPKDLGPIRLCAIDADGERYDNPACGVLTDWVLVTASQYPRRYVRVPMVENPEAARYYLAQGVLMLQILLNCPEIEVLPFP